MAKQVLLKSLSTGLTGLYPESHLDQDPDLILSEEDSDCGCWATDDFEEGDLEPELLPALEDKETTDGE